MEQTSEANRPAAIERRPEKYGWRINDWSAAVGCSRARTYELIAGGRIDTVKLGTARLVLTHPRDFLESLRGAA